MKHKCSKCGHEDEINPGAILGAIRTPKKEAAWKANGERLKTMFANARKLGDSAPIVAQHANPEYQVGHHSFTPNPPGFIAPKGSFSKEDLKALMGENRQSMSSFAVDSIPVGPVFPFDYEENCEKYRVREEKNGLGLYWVGEDEERRVRSLKPEELEQLWTKRIK